jgi:hypothetical protein
MTTKLDEIFNHILDMNSLSHFTFIWKVPFIWFHENIQMRFFIQTNVNVWMHNFFWKNTIIWKVTKNVLEALCQKSILCVFQNVRWNERKSTPQITQNAFQMFFFSCPKCTTVARFHPYILTNFFVWKLGANTLVNHVCIFYWTLMIFSCCFRHLKHLEREKL